jgi:hypothetical protein
LALGERFARRYRFATSSAASHVREPRSQARRWRLKTMVGSGVALDPLIFQGLRAMTPIEMEDALKILPTLATKTDVSDVKRHMDIRFEDVRDDIAKVAEGVASMIVKVDRNDARLGVVVTRLETHEAILKVRSRRGEETSAKVDALTARLENRGVI